METDQLAYLDPSPQNVNQRLPLQTLWEFSLDLCSKESVPTAIRCLDTSTKSVLRVSDFASFFVGLPKIPRSVHP
jgi:hypothetical protein